MRQSEGVAIDVERKQEGVEEVEGVREGEKE
jgi:hypothetical protein